MEEAANSGNFPLHDAIDESAIPDEYYDQLSVYDYVQLMYEIEDIPLSILDEVIPTVEFLVSTAVACDYSQLDANGYPYYEQPLSYHDYYRG